MGDERALGLRHMNRLRVLETLYRYPGSSRADLTRHTGLSRPTVSGLVEEMVRAGVVQERSPADCAAPVSDPGLPEGDDGRRASGRPPSRLSLVGGAAFAVGLDFGHQHIRVAVCDLSGHPVVDEWSAAEVDHAPAASLDLAAELVGQALGDADIASERVLGVGMGLAAPVNKLTGRLEADGILPGWHGIDPVTEMESRLGIGVELENDANVGALGEKAFGAAHDVDDFVYIRLSAGIGAGLILGGRPYHGFGGVAGEIGHVLSDPAGPICRCGNRGCLEAIASPVAVAGLLEGSLGQPVSVKRMLELVAAGDRGARRAVSESGEAVGRAAAALVNILNPELVVVGGDLAQTGEVLLQPIAAGIERHSVAPAVASVRVCAGLLGERAEVLGAAALVLSKSPRALVRQLDT
jgi:predicted NBD/HSP70 family sugar kinase